jgi:hypothetical protein
MPWHTERDHEGCPSEKPVAVVKDDDGSVAGCHANEEDAQAQIAALHANEGAAAMAAHVENNAELCDPENPWAVVDDDSGEVLGCFADEEAANEKLAEVAGVPDGPPAAGLEIGARFEALLVVEGHETADGRMFELQSVTWRDLPVPLMVQIETGPGGHVGAWFGGSIEEVMRDPTEASRILAAGRFAGPRADEAESYVRAGLRGISVDVSGSEVVVEGFDPDEEGAPTRYLERYGDARIMGATITPFAAFEETQIWLPDEMPEPDVVKKVAGSDVEHGEEQQPMLMFADRRRAGLVAACAECAPGYRPPASFFAEPRLGGPTALTIDDDGYVYGHIGLWDSCHTGMRECFTPPRSSSGYAYFHTGEVVCDDGSRVAVGHISMTTDPKADGHEYDVYASAPQALAHYDNTGLVVADVRAGEDRHGVWVAGALRYGLPANRLAEFRASPPSGDWRPLGTGRELIHVLAVNAPGFPVPRVRLDGAGQPLALVAAAAPHPRTDRERIAALEHEVNAMRRLLRAETLNRLDARARVRRVTELDRRVHR